MLLARLSQTQVVRAFIEFHGDHGYHRFCFTTARTNIAPTDSVGAMTWPVTKFLTQSIHMKHCLLEWEQLVYV